MQPGRPLTPRERKEKLARLIARDFERASFDHEDAVMLPGFTWEGIERLARRLELMPEDVAALLVYESCGCTVLENPTEILVARPTRATGGLN